MSVINLNIRFCSWRVSHVYLLLLLGNIPLSNIYCCEILVELAFNRKVLTWFSPLPTYEYICRAWACSIDWSPPPSSVELRAGRGPCSYLIFLTYLSDTPQLCNRIQWLRQCTSVWIFRLLFCFAKQECGVSEPKYLVQSEFIRIVHHNHATHASAAAL